MTLSRTWSCGATAAVMAFCMAGAASAEDIVIHAGKLIDGVSKTAREQVSIVIHDDRVVLSTLVLRRRRARG